MHVTVPKLEYAGEVHTMGRERQIRKTTGNSADENS